MSLMVCVAEFVIKMVMKDCVKAKLILESHRNARRMSFAFMENMIPKVSFMFEAVSKIEKEKLILESHRNARRMSFAFMENMIPMVSFMFEAVSKIEKEKLVVKQIRLIQIGMSVFVTPKTVTRALVMNK